MSVDEAFVQIVFNYQKQFSTKQWCKNLLEVLCLRTSYFVIEHQPVAQYNFELILYDLTMLIFLSISNSRYFTCETSFILLLLRY